MGGLVTVDCLRKRFTIFGAVGQEARIIKFGDFLFRLGQINYPVGIIWPQPVEVALRRPLVQIEEVVSGRFFAVVGQVGFGKVSNYIQVGFVVRVHPEK